MPGAPREPHTLAMLCTTGIPRLLAASCSMATAPQRSRPPRRKTVRRGCSVYRKTASDSTRSQARIASAENVPCLTIAPQTSLLPQGNQPQLPDLPPPQCEKGGGGPGCGPPPPPPPTTCPNGGTPSRYNNPQLSGNVKNGAMTSIIVGGTAGVIIINILEPETLPFDYFYPFATGAGAMSTVGIPAAVAVTTPTCP